MHLKELLAPLPSFALPAAGDVTVPIVTADSRQVVPGAVFVAVRGIQADGHAFLGDAAARGASLLVGEAPDPGLQVPYQQVSDSRLAWAELCASWFGFPASRLTMIGVTGTDGKTTTASLIHHILGVSGLRAGLVSTVSARIGPRQIETGLHVTTPDPWQLQGLLSEMVEAGLTYAVLEATSHGLAQKRVAACAFDLGVVTNITHEHLDYHQSFEDYRLAKAELIRMLDERAAKSGSVTPQAVLNADDASFDFMQDLATVPVISYGVGRKADVMAARSSSGRDGLQASFSWKGREWAVTSRLLGGYNLHNLLAAFASTAAGVGVEPDEVVRALASFDGIPGRMERVDLGQPFLAVVDFAHTPNALKQALEAARQLTGRRVLAVFGSAGLRDRAKRGMMAETGARLADICILTAEDPRTESLDAILDEMARGAERAGGVEGRTFFRQRDRGQALRQAVAMAAPGDLVMACGKGHEQSMCFGDVEYPWDDRTAMRAALSELLGVPGPAMPSLPSTPGPEARGA